jgi:hypothetical protein
MRVAKHDPPPVPREGYLMEHEPHLSTIVNHERHRGHIRYGFCLISGSPCGAGSRAQRSELLDSQKAGARGGTPASCRLANSYHRHAEAQASGAGAGIVSFGVPDGVSQSV